MNREDELQGIIDFQIVEIKKLKTALGKARVVLLNYNPKDDWFPLIEKQFSDVMTEVEQALEGGN
jgi:hypothetical protein